MSPGYLPFKDALDLPAFFCENCGFWQRHFAEPTSCPLCVDSRHVLPQTAWRFHTREAAVSLYPCHWDEVEPGVWRFFNHPVLYDRTRHILFCGDALKFELDPADPRRAVTISAHKAFVRGIPLTPGELRRYRSVFEALDFRQTWTPFEQASNSGRPDALALIDSMLSTRPHAYPVPLDDLRPTAEGSHPSSPSGGGACAGIKS